MAVCYQKLWHLLLDMRMKKKELEAKAQISNYAMRKLAKDEMYQRKCWGKFVKR